MGSYSPERHVRLIRFDFHPTTDGWSVSEVNSDVPGGLLMEASVLPRIAQPYFPQYEPQYGLQFHWRHSKENRSRCKDCFCTYTSYADDHRSCSFRDYF